MKTVILENDVLKIELLPGLGGKIISFLQKDKAFELAAQPEREMKSSPDKEMRFSDYAYGMDDTFPNIDSEILHWKGKTFDFPDHGEIWKSSLTAVKQKPHEVTLSMKSEAFSFEYEKTLVLEEDRLRMKYRIVNFGNHELPCLWTWHGLLHYEEDMVLTLPKEITHFRNVLADSCLGDVGTVYPKQNPVYDFEKVPKAESLSMVKFYGEEAVKNGICEIFYPKQQVSCKLSYDAQALPYLGVWITAGGFCGDYNLAVEPSSGFYDSVSKARENGKLPVLGAGDVMEFEVSISSR